MNEFERIAREQGWNDESIIIHLKGFIAHIDKAFDGAVDSALGKYARDVQDEENVELP